MRKLNKRMNGLLTGIAAAALFGAVFGGGCYKRAKEDSSSMKYSPKEAIEILNSANEIEMREIPFCWGKRYNIVVGDEKVGTVYERVFNWGKKFDLYAGTEESGEFIGHAEERIFSVGHKSDVYDSTGKKIGGLDQVVLTLNPGHLIEIYDGSGRKLGVSDELSLTWTHETEIYDENKSVIGCTKKSVFWDDYTLNTTSDIDRRVLLALMAMEDKLDDEREKRDEEKKKKRD